MKKISSLGKVLSRDEAKKIKGGDDYGGYGGGGGRCYRVSGSNNSSCWYATSSSSETLCTRVYPGQVCMTSLNQGDGTCTSDCHLN